MVQFRSHEKSEEFEMVDLGCMEEVRNLFMEELKKSEWDVTYVVGPGELDDTSPGREIVGCSLSSSYKGKFHIRPKKSE